MSDEIKVGFCVAYDWHFLQYALPLIYKSSDQICLSLDKDRISWSGNSYFFDEVAFKKLIGQIDVDNKISVLEENYHLPELTPMQNEVRQRNSIANHLGKGGWHLQLDCDEFFLKFNEFSDYLKSLPSSKTKKSNVCCQWIILYKQLQYGFLYVDPGQKKNVEFMQIATKEPFYEYGRRNGNFNIDTNFKIVHQSWARDDKEIKEKIFNWGHSDDFDRDQYFDQWCSLNETNYQHFKNFHPLQPSVWFRLGFVECSDIAELMEKIILQPFPSFSSSELFYKNSRFFSRLRALFKI
jgi:hypothetical protein